MLPMTGYLAFVGTATGAVLMPGPDMLVVLRTALAGGARAGAWAAAGSAVGNLVWGTATVLGATALLTASAFAFTALKLAGAATWAGSACRRCSPHAAATCWPGSASLPRVAARAGRSATGSPAIWPTSRSACSGPRSYRSSSRRTAEPSCRPRWSATMPALVFTGLAGYALLAARLRSALGRPGVSRAVNATIGALLVALAAKLAS